MKNNWHIYWLVHYCLPGKCYSSLSQEFTCELDAQLKANQFKKEHPEYEVWVGYRSRII